MDLSTAIALSGLGISVVALLIAFSQYRSSKRSADAAEASAESAKLAADASVRSADAAERSTSIQERALGHEEHRARHEKAREEERLAPALEPVANHAQGAFNFRTTDGTLNAHFVNSGLSTAVIESAELRHLNGTTSGSLQYYEKQGPIGNGPQSTLRLPVQARLLAQFEVEANNILRAADPPVVFITYRAESGSYKAQIQCPLHRADSGAQGRPLWNAGEIKTVRLDQ